MYNYIMPRLRMSNHKRARQILKGVWLAKYIGHYTTRKASVQSSIIIIIIIIPILDIKIIDNIYY